MPYGRISQVRFEVLVMRRPWAFPAWRGLSADAQYAPTSMVCPGCSSISYVGSLSALCPTAPLNDGTTKYPESLCPVSALPPLGRRGPSPRRALPLPRRSYGLIRRSRHLSSTSALASLEEVFAGCHQPLPLTGPSRRYSANPSSDARALTPAVLLGAFAWFFPSVIGLPKP
jgi:hypothetical protein